MSGIILPTTDKVARPEAMGYDGYIDNVLIRLAASEETPLEDLTADASPPKVDTSESAEDVRDEVGQRYSRSNLSGGAGLDFLHSPLRPDDAAIRYWDSRGVDVFGTDRGDIYDARLMNTVAEEQAETGIHSVVHIDGSIYFADATEIRESDGTLLYTGTGIDKMVAMGNSVYILDDSGIGRIDPPTWTRNSVSTDSLYENIWAVKSRIVASKDNLLYDTTDDSLLTTLPVFDHVTDVIDVGPAVLVLATTGSAYFLSLDQSLSLVPAGESKFTDEIPILGIETFGVIGIVTAEYTEAGGRVARFYTAELAVSGNYDLASLQLVYQVGERDSTDNHTPMALYASRDSIYAAIREPGETAITLWRYYLPTGGYARGLELDDVAFDGSEAVESIVEVDDRMYFAVSGHGLWKQTSDYIVSGFIIGPLADFYTASSKQWVAGELTGTAVPSGASLELYQTDDPALINEPDSESWQLVTQLLATETSKSVNNIAGFDSRYHAAKIILRSNSGRTATAALRSYSFRALPNPDRDIHIRIPINVSDQVESPGRRAVTVKGRGYAVEQALRVYEGEQVIVELYRPQFQVLGLIEKFEGTITSIPTRGSVRRVMYARIRGSRIQSTESIIVQTDGASLGQDVLGHAVLGEGEPLT